MSETTNPPRRPSKLWNIGCIAGLLLLGGCGVWLGFAVRDAQEAARAAGCKGCLKLLTLAFHNYQDKYGTLPPAVTFDADGRPMHSWRVLILPFVDHETEYREYDFSQPWDSPHNRRLESTVRSAFLQCPSQPAGKNPLHTNYVVVIGKATAFPLGKTVAFKEVTDGMDNTLLLVEVAGTGIHWMEPRDLNVDEMSFLTNDPNRPSPSSVHPRHITAAFLDGSVRRVPLQLNPQILRGLTTIAGDEPVGYRDLDSTNLAMPR